MHDQDITRLLHDWQAGDQEALDNLTNRVYDQLRVLADRIFRGENAGHTLQPTALVNEAMQRLMSSDVDWQDRNHFFALSARIMRRILVNHAVAKKSAKRGGDSIRVTMQESHASTDAETGAEILALDSAISELATFDKRKAEAVELHYFAGMTYRELADVLGITESTVHQDLRTAKAWLHQKLAG
jgi:RNA polymerase sigma factor (TIGR02999 family)